MLTIPGSRACGSAGPCTTTSGTQPSTAATNSSRRARTRRSSASRASVATATAAANPATAATSRVPERTSRSWPPPCCTAVSAACRRASRAPIPYGPPSLWEVKVSRSSPLAAKSTATWPTACTASLCETAPQAVAAASAAWRTGCSAPTSLLPQINETTAGRRGDLGGQRAGVDHAVGPHGQQPDPGPGGLFQPGRRIQDGVVLHRGDDHLGPGRVRPGPVGALDRQVVGLGPAGGEDQLGRDWPPPAPRSARGPPRPPGARLDPSRAARTRCRPVRAARSWPPRPEPSSGWWRHGRDRSAACAQCAPGVGMQAISSGAGTIVASLRGGED